jgi:putative transposase
VAWGVPAGPELVRSLMRELGLAPCQPRPWRVSLTEGDGQEHDIPDLVDRDFTADAPGRKMAGDITYIPTWEGWLFLATVIDCHTKAVIGWAADDNYKTPLIEKAIGMAARNYPLAGNAIFLSDYAEDGVKPRNRGLACSGGLADGFFGLTFGAIGDCRGPGACLR